ncbi:MAG: hypothetical protein WD766_13535 [Gemmatimonadota bacterium]
MKPAYALLLSGTFSVLAGPLWAQERDAQILRPGEVRLSIGAEYRHADTQFGAGGSERIGGELEASLTAATVATLGTVASDFSRFLADTKSLPGASQVDPFELTAGDLSVEAAVNRRFVPVRLSAGIFPRVEIDVEIPVYREERLLRRFSTEGGNVGINPDPSSNAELLAGISEAGESLAGAALLPVEGSALADELQRRVLTLTGSELDLPAAPVPGTQLSSVSALFPAARSLTQWQPGDVRIGARVGVLRSFGDSPFPPLSSGERHHRLTAFAAVRVPTGREWVADSRLGAGSTIGFAGGQAGAVADLFLGERYWLSGGGSYARVASTELDVPVPPAEGIYTGEPVLTTIRRSPGDAYDLWFVPRIRLTPVISFGGSLRSERWLAGMDEIGSLQLPTTAASRHSAGISVRYTTLPVSSDGGFDIAIGYAGAFAGSGRAEAASVAYFQVAVRQRVLGRSN